MLLNSIVPEPLAIVSSTCKQYLTVNRVRGRSFIPRIMYFSSSSDRREPLSRRNHCRHRQSQYALSLPRAILSRFRMELIYHRHQPSSPKPVRVYFTMNNTKPLSYENSSIVAVSHHRHCRRSQYVVLPPPRAIPSHFRNSIVILY